MVIKDKILKFQFNLLFMTVNCDWKYSFSFCNLYLFSGNSIHFPRLIHTLQSTNCVLGCVKKVKKEQQHYFLHIHTFLNLILHIVEIIGLFVPVSIHKSNKLYNNFLLILQINELAYFLLKYCQTLWIFDCLPFFALVFDFLNHTMVPQNCL